MKPWLEALLPITVCCFALGAAACGNVSRVEARINTNVPNDLKIIDVTFQRANGKRPFELPFIVSEPDPNLVLPASIVFDTSLIDETIRIGVSAESKGDPPHFFEQCWTFPTPKPPDDPVDSVTFFIDYLCRDALQSCLIAGNKTCLGGRRDIPPDLVRISAFDPRRDTQRGINPQKCFGSSVGMDKLDVPNINAADTPPCSFTFTNVTDAKSLRDVTIAFVTSDGWGSVVANDEDGLVNVVLPAFDPTDAKNIKVITDPDTEETTVTLEDFVCQALLDLSVKKVWIRRSDPTCPLPTFDTPHESP